MDLSGDYPYLEDSDGKIYNDNIVEQGKEDAKIVGPSDIGVGPASSTSADVKTLIDYMLQKLLTDNQIREDQIMAHINVLAHVNEDSK